MGDGTDLVIKNMQRDDEGSYLCKAVQNVRGEGGAIKYSDFRDLVIHLRIEQSPAWLDDQMGGQFYGYVTGTANLTCQAEAEPPPAFRWLDAENQPVTEGQVVNDQYKVFIHNDDDFDNDDDDVNIIHQMNMITLIMILMS